MREANDFVNGGYSRLRQETLNGIGNVTDELARLHQRGIELENEIARLANRAATLPDQVIERFVDKHCPRGIRRLCRDVLRARHVANPAKRQLLNHVESARRQLTELRTKTISSAKSRLAELNRALAELDAKLQGVRQQLQDRVLDQAAEIARKKHELTQKVFAQTRKLNAGVQRLDAQFQARIAVWRNDQQRVDAIAQPTPVEALTPVTQKEGQVEKGSDPPQEPARPTNTSAYACANIDGSYFSIVGSFRTAQGAVRHMKNLKAKGIDFGLDVLRPHYREMAAPWLTHLKNDISGAKTVGTVTKR